MTKLTRVRNETTGAEYTTGHVVDGETVLKEEAVDHRGNPRPPTYPDAPDDSGPSTRTPAKKTAAKTKEATE